LPLEILNGVRIIALLRIARMVLLHGGPHSLENLQGSLLHRVANDFRGANIRIGLGHVVNEAMDVLQTMVGLPGEAVSCDRCKIVKIC